MTKDIYKALCRDFANYQYELTNTYVFGWESDYFAISKSGYSVEVEVKVSRSDFRADFKKVQKHKILEGAMVGNRHIILPGSEYKEFDTIAKEYRAQRTSIHILEIDKMLVPNKFYYACPDGMIKKDEVPPYAGLFYLVEKDEGFGPRQYLKQIKAAKFIHKRPQNYSKILMDKFYYRCLDLERTLFEMKLTIGKFNHIYRAPKIEEEANSIYIQAKLFY